jgi:TatD DNase family protein
MIDTHVNLHHEKFADCLDDVLERARGAGIDGLVSISDRIANTDAIAAITDRLQEAWSGRVWRTVGAHPHYAKDHLDLTAQRLVELAAESNVIGIGETGLDFHYNWSPEQDQIQVFKAHIEAARQTGLPLVVHTRQADAITADILEEERRKGDFPVLLHCYTSGMDLLERALALDAYVSFSGIVTFKAAEEVRQAARTVPLDRMLIETDCPYLAPVPMRGRDNEPAFLPHVASFLATLLDQDPVDFVQQVDRNFFALFQRAQ